MNKRIYHPFHEWEEIEANMWGEVANRKVYLKKAIAFTSDHKKYGRFMVRVICEWPNSCENALTDQNLNKKAWIGHAATALALACPEDITREAWGYLTDEQRTLANREADRAISIWENSRRSGEGVREYMDREMLF
jgi:hypothetical protein